MVSDDTSFLRTIFFDVLNSRSKGWGNERLNASDVCTLQDRNLQKWGLSILLMSTEVSVV